MSSQTSLIFSGVQSCLYVCTLLEIPDSSYGGSQGLEPETCSVQADTEAEMESSLFPGSREEI